MVWRRDGEKKSDMITHFYTIQEHDKQQDGWTEIQIDTARRHRKKLI